MDQDPLDRGDQPAIPPTPRPLTPPTSAPQRPYPPPAAPRISDHLAIRMLLPVGRSPLAILAGYLGLLSVTCVFAPFALVTGVLAIVHMRRNPRKHGMGRAVFGIVMGAIFTIVGLVALILQLKYT
jgi:hypothetical protein